MRKMGKPLKNVLGALLVLLIFLSAGAAVADELLVYTALEDDEIPGYLEIFKKAHPDIEIKIVRDSTGIVTAKLLAEKDNPQADVVWGTAATSLMLCDQAGMVAPYAPKGLEKVRPKMRDANNPPHWVGKYRRMRQPEAAYSPVPRRPFEPGVPRSIGHAQPGFLGHRFPDGFRHPANHGRRKRMGLPRQTT